MRVASVASKPFRDNPPGWHIEVWQKISKSESVEAHLRLRSQAPGPIHQPRRELRRVKPNWRKTMRTAVTTLILACLLGVAASTASAQSGQAVYAKSCKSCHGADGTPNPAIAKMMKIDMKDLKSPEVQAISNEDQKKIITAGKGKMKPITSVSGPALDDVVAYVRSLKK